MMPLLMTTLMAVVPMHDRGRVMGNVTLAMSVAPALGPAVSGVILQLPLLALDLPGRAADRRRHRRLRLPQADQRRRAGRRQRRLAERRDRRDRLRQPGLRPQRGRRAGRPHPRVRRPGRRRGRRRLLRLAPAGAAAQRPAAAGPAHPAHPGLLGLAGRDGLRLHGDARLDDPAAALPPERARDEPAGDRHAGDARWPGDGPARPSCGTGLRRPRRPGAGHPGCDRPDGLDGDVRRARRGDTDLADPGRPRRADGQPGRAVHAGVHDGSRLAAGAPLLPRQLAARHHPAGGRCHGHRPRRDRHVEPRDLAGRRRGRPADCLAGRSAVGVRRVGRCCVWSCSVWCSCCRRGWPTRRRAQASRS